MFIFRLSPTWLLLCAWLCLLASGCTPRAFRLNMPHNRMLSETEATSVRESLDRAPITSRSSARVSMFKEGQRQTFRLATVYRFPGWYRFELLPLNTAFGLALLKINPGDRALLLDFGEQAALLGEVTELTGRLAAPVSLRSSEMLALASGKVWPGMLKETHGSGNQLFHSKAVSRYVLRTASGWWEFDDKNNLWSAQCTDKKGRVWLSLQRPVLDGAIRVELNPSQFSSFGWLVTEAVGFEIMPGAPKLDRKVAENLFSLDIPPGFSLTEF